MRRRGERQMSRRHAAVAGIGFVTPFDATVTRHTPRRYAILSRCPPFYVVVVNASEDELSVMVEIEAWISTGGDGEAYARQRHERETRAVIRGVMACSAGEGGPRCAYGEMRTNKAGNSR